MLIGFQTNRLAKTRVDMECVGRVDDPVRVEQQFVPASAALGGGLVGTSDAQCDGPVMPALAESQRLFF